MGPIAQKDHMLRLTLFRHADAALGGDGLEDFDRSLTERGQAAAGAMAHAMVAAGISPSLILCSAAQRARETLACAAPILRGDCRTEIERALYLASADTVFDRLRGIESADTEVMVIGHNPGLHALALVLAEPAESKTYRDLATNFPTAALAEIGFQAERWTGLKRGHGILRRFVTPRSLMQEG